MSQRLAIGGALSLWWVLFGGIANAADPPAAPPPKAASPAAPKPATPGSPKPAAAPKPPAEAAAPKAPAEPAAPAAPKPPTDASAPKSPDVAPSGAPPVAATSINPMERARQGVVVLERGGRALALGVVLDGDGRILTALSPLTNGNFITARYHDGTQAPVKLVHSDRSWDLALLVASAPPKADAKPPQRAGVRAAKLAVTEGAQVLTLARPPNTLTALPAPLKLSAPLVGADGHALPDAYELGFRAKDLGAPIVNEQGEVLAIVARACPAGSGAGCTPAPFGMPVTALKQFLRKVPAEATWLGIQGAADELDSVRGVRVVSVSTGGPAAQVGLRPGAVADGADLIVAVNGAPVATPGELSEAVRGRISGDTVELLVFGWHRYRLVVVAPRGAPEPTASPRPRRPRPSPDR